MEACRGRAADAYRVQPMPSEPAHRHARRTVYGIDARPSLELPMARPQLDAESRSWCGCACTRRSRSAARRSPSSTSGCAARRRSTSAIASRICRSSPRSDIDDLATQAAGDALIALLRKLEDYRGDSKFWTWARRFADLEAG